MLKKLIFLSLGLVMAFGASAQEGNNAGHIKNIARAKSVSFPASDVQYWVGSGSNSAVVVVGWDDNPNGNFALAWGVHWNGNTTALGLIDSIATHDSRFSYTFSSSLMGNITYNDGTLVSGSSMGGWCYYLNGNWAMNAYNNQPVSNGDAIEVSSSCSFSMTTATAATDPNGSTTTDPVDATIDTADILYWVGTGSNRAVFIVNFGDPDTAFAWGYRFNGTTTAQAMVDAIANEDPRFWTVGSPSYNGDIHFVTSTGDTLGLVDGSTTPLGYNFWWTNLNGVSAGSGSASSIHDGDVFKYGDQSVGVGWDPMGTYFMEYAWVKEPTPVPVPGSEEMPEEATIAASDIVYWVGEGSKEVVFAVNWADTALAWGYRFNGESVGMQTVMDDIASNDPRFSYTMDGGYLNDINFVAGSDTLAITMYNYWENTVNGVSSSGMGAQLHNGDFTKWADPAAGVVVDSSSYEWDGVTYWMYINVYPMSIHPVSAPLPEESTISASDIVYWVGEGSSEIVFAVNWANRALAWGYRFDGESVGMQTVMNDIQAADPRFSYNMDGGYLNDILFVVNADTFSITPNNYWENKVNGVMSAGMSAQLHNGDFTKWADPVAGIVVDSFYYDGWGWSYIYNYTMPVYPVSVPIVSGPFCGAVGTEGCNAIAANSEAIKAWATGCTVERGYQVISTAAAYASYGQDSYAVGPVDMNDNLTVVSLGDGGTATLTFDKPIVNGEGYDFAVYENSFGDSFLELAFVEVSSDGERFVRFPAISLTQTEIQTGGNGSTDPTMINNLAGKFRMGYGTPFDLNELRDSTGLDINNITYVRIVDVVGSIDPEYATRDSEGRIINDPWPTPGNSSGFDLDGVAVINQKSEGVDMAESVSLSIYPNPATDRVSIILNGIDNTEAVLFDINGRALMTLNLHQGTNTIGVNDLPQGVYILRAGTLVHKVVKR